MLKEYAGELAVYADVQEKLKRSMERMAAFVEQVDEEELRRLRGEDKEAIARGMVWGRLWAGGNRSLSLQASRGTVTLRCLHPSLLDPSLTTHPQSFQSSGGDDTCGKKLMPRGTQSLERYRRPCAGATSPTSWTRRWRWRRMLMRRLSRMMPMNLSSDFVNRSL